MDMEKARREQIRWLVMVAVNAGRPEPVAEPLVLSAIQGVPVQCTALELRREIDYLEDRKLVTTSRHEGAPWTVELSRHGVDFVEYTIDAQPGIARPKKYW